MVLQEASYKGVPFSVTGSDLSIGRRVQVFEYPMRDKPFIEDLGRSVRTITVHAFIIGKDCIQRLNKLKTVLEEPGGGELIHPWEGSMQVVPTQLSNITFSEAINKIEFTLTFVERGELSYPASEADTQGRVRTTALEMREGVVKRFTDYFDLSKAQDYVKSSVAEHFGDILSSSQAQIGGLIKNAEVARHLMTDAANLMGSSKAEFANMCFEALGFGDITREVGSWRGAVTNAISTFRDNRDVPTVSKPFRGSSEAIEADAKTELNALVRGIALYNAVSASANIATEYEVNKSTIAYEEVIGIMSGLMDALDEEQSQTKSDEVFVALQDARGAVWADLSERANNMSRLIDFTPPEVMPALVLAYDLYEDAEREAEIVDRNRIPRGGFVPVQPLKILEI